MNAVILLPRYFETIANGTSTTEWKLVVVIWKILSNKAWIFHSSLINSDVDPPIIAAQSGEQMNDVKAPGPNDLHMEFLRVLYRDGKKWLTKIFKHIYDTGGFLETDHICSYTERNQCKQCEDYRLNILMSQLLKLSLKIILKRIYKTKETLFSIQVW